MAAAHEPPCACGCPALAQPVHAVALALAVDDLDRALALGLLDVAPCPACTPGCTDTVAQARNGRLAAFAARERHRAREARLQRRAAARAERRAARSAAVPGETPALPPAAVDALARALAKARATTRKPGG